LDTTGAVPWEVVDSPGQETAVVQVHSLVVPAEEDKVHMQVGKVVHLRGKRVMHRSHAHDEQTAQAAALAAVVKIEMVVMVVALVYFSVPLMKVI
jgi:hypothetical protein